jgi:hypothetical protein
MRHVLRAWERFWFAPESTATLAVFRIAFGLLVLAWTISLTPELFSMFSDDGILPEQPYGFTEPNEWGLWGPLGIFESDGAVVVAFVLLLIASLCLVVGFQSRLAAVLVFLGLLAFQRRNTWVFNSGDSLLRVLSFYLMLAPSGAALSVDRWRKAKDRFWEFPLRAPWAIRLIQVQISILYIAAVWHKARGATWNDGTAVSYALRVADIERFPVPDFLVESLIISNLMTYGTLALELSLGILIWNRRLRPYVLALGVSMHLGIDYAIRVAFFSLGVISAYIAFVPGETMNGWLLALRRRLEQSRRPVLRRLALRAPALRDARE